MSSRYDGFTPSWSKSAKARRFMADVAAQAEQSRIVRSRSLSPKRLSRPRSPSRWPSPPTEPQEVTKFKPSTLERFAYNLRSGVERLRKSGVTAETTAQGLVTTSAAIAAAAGLGVVGTALLPGVVAAGSLAALAGALIQLQLAYKTINRRDELARDLVSTISTSIQFLTMYLNTKTRSRISRQANVIDTENKLTKAVKNFTVFLKESGKEKEEMYSRRLLMHSEIITSLIQQLMMIKQNNN